MMKFAQKKTFTVRATAADGRHLTFPVEAFTRDEAHMDAARVLNCDHPDYTLTQILDNNTKEAT